MTAQEQEHWRRPLWIKLRDKCVNFNGIINDQCNAGVAYRDIRDVSTSPYGFPCFADRPCGTRCEKAEFLTDEQAQVKAEEIGSRARAHFAKLAANTCPHCDQPMTKTQVGSCVYADPCGHRLYHGRIS